MSRLFDRTAREVGEGLDFEYNAEEAENSQFFLRNARRLPRDARPIFPFETGKSL